MWRGVHDGDAAMSLGCGGAMVDLGLHRWSAVKLFVAAVLIASLAVGAKLAVERIAPEKVASASNSDTAGGAKAATGLVQSIRVTGSGLRATALLPLLETREGAPLHDGVLDADRLRLVRALAADGYLDAGVEEPKIRALASGITVELPVVAGPRYVIRDVRLEGRQVRRHPDLTAVPTLHAGNDALAERIDGNVALLRTWLADRGTTASVGVDLDIDRYTQQVDVVFTIN